MAENQTVETKGDVNAFLRSVENDVRRADAHVLVELMQRVTGVEPRMWGPAIIGFGKYRYRYDSGREGEISRVGFSPRKANLALYLTFKGPDYEDHLARLGKHKTGASCLYINKLADVDLHVLESIVAQSWESTRAEYGENV